MIRRAPTLSAVLLLVACAWCDETPQPCSFDENGSIVAEAGNAIAGCAEPAALRRGATREKTGRLTILEAPLPPPFFDLASKGLREPPNEEPKLVRPAVPPELAYYIRTLPQADRPSGDVLDLASYHTIVLRDSCFFLDRDGDDDPLVQFPYDAALTIDKEGYLAFGSRYEPNPMGSVRVGVPAATGWYSQPTEASPELAADCGNHKIVSVATVADPFASPEHFNPPLRRYGERSGDNPSQVIVKANACAVRQAKREADRRLRDPDLEQVDCTRFWGL